MDLELLCRTTVADNQSWFRKHTKLNNRNDEVAETLQHTPGKSKM